MSGRHASAAAAPRARRRRPVLVALATVLGLWLGWSAPDVSPVAAPAPAVQVQPADTTVDVPAPPQQGGRQRDGGR